MKLKKIMAIVLCLSMVLGTMNFSVFAEDTTVVTVSTTEEAQAALDAATEGTIIQLTSNVEYGVLYVGRPTKSNDTTMYCGTDEYTTKSASEFATHLSDNQYHTTPRYTTNLKDVTIIGDDGATVGGVLATSGHIYGDVYDYVLEKDYDEGSAYYSTLNITNLTFSGVNFTGNVNINTSDETSVYDGVTFDGCTFTTNGIESTNGAAIRYYNEANNGNVKNIEVKDCSFKNCYQGVYVHHVSGVTVTDSEFDTTGHNAIALQNHDGAVDFGTVEICENTFTNINDRVIRFGDVGTTDISINNNIIVNSGDEDGQLIKATTVAKTATVDLESNYWDGKDVSTAVATFTAPTVVGITGGTWDCDVSTYVAEGYEMADDGTVSETITTEYAAYIGEIGYETLAAAIEGATSGDTILLSEGTHTWTTIYKDLTIKGADGADKSKVIIDMGTTVGSDQTATITVAFEGVTLDRTSAGANHYKGFWHAVKETYTDCIINGEYWTYATTAVFTNCTFNQTSSDAYNLWTYSSSNVTIEGCTFNSAGKSVLVYNEAGPATQLDVTKTAFNASSSVSGKAAIEIDTSAPNNSGAMDGTTITIDGETTATGFATDTLSGSSLWNDKKVDTTNTNGGGTSSTVIVNGTTVKAAAVEVTETYVAKIGDTTYATLQEAFDAATDGNTITLLSDVTLDSGMTIQKSGTLTIDGDGYSISPEDESNLGYQAIYFNGNSDCTYNLSNITFKNFVQSNVDALILRLENAKQFNLTNVTFDNCDVAKGTSTVYSMMRVYNTNLEADNLTIKNSKAAMMMDIGPSSDSYIGKIVIKNSTFESNTALGTALIYPTLKSAENSYLSVSATTFKNNVIGDATAEAPDGRGVIHLSSDAFVDGCTFDGNTVYGSHTNNISYGINNYSKYNLEYTNNEFKNSAVYQTNATLGPVAGLAMMAVGTAKVEGNTVENNNKFYNRASAAAEYTEYPARSVGSYSESYGITTITSGTYNGAVVTYADDKSIEIAGGTFDTDVTAYVADGYTLSENEDGTYGVVKAPVAKIGDVEYTDLQSAIDGAVDGATIEIIEDFALTSQEFTYPNYDRLGYAGVIIPDDKTLVIDLAGHTITYSDAYGDFDNAMIINIGDLTINDSVGKGELAYSSNDNDLATATYTYLHPTILNGGKLTLNNGVTVKNTAPADTDCTNAIENHSHFSYQYENDAVCIVNDANLIANKYFAVRQYTHYHTGYANDVIINDGRVTGIYMQQGDSWWNQSQDTNRYAKGSLTINGGRIETLQASDDYTCYAIRMYLSSPENPNWSIAINDGIIDDLSIRVQRGTYYVNGTSGDRIDAEANGARNAEWLEANGGFITGGTFTNIGSEADATSNVLSFLADGYTLTANEDGTYGVVEETDGLSGSGTEEDPYLINSLDELKWFRDDVNNGNNYSGKTVKLNADIDLAGEIWTPIGDTTYTDKYVPADASVVFSGTFDGNGKIIKNLTIEKILDGGADEEATVGLFGITGEGAVIKNLTLTNVSITTDGRNVGAVAGFAYKTVLDNITVNGDIKISGGNNVSGVCAMTRYCDNTATDISLVGNDGSYIKGNNIVGGLFAEIAPNGATQTFDKLSVENVAIEGVSGVGGIVGLLTLGAISNVSVKNVTMVGKTTWKEDEDRIRLGSVVGLLGSQYGTVSGTVTVENVTAKNLEDEAVELPYVGANYDGSIGNATEAKIGDTFYATFAKALSIAEDGDTIELLADITEDEVILISKSLTIDGNGHTVTSSASRVFRVTTSDVDVTLNNVNMVSTATWEYPNDIRGISIDGGLENVTLTLNSCTVDFDEEYVTDWCYAVNVSANSTVGIKLNVNGGTYEGANVINVADSSAAAVTVTGATLNCKYGANDQYCGMCINLKNTANTLVASGNTFTGDNARAYYTSYGTVEASDNTDNTKYYVAKVGTTYYYDFAEAIENAVDGDTVTLIQSVTVADKTTITKSITLDGNNRTLTYTGSDRAIEMSNVADADYNVTIKNLTVNCSASYCERGINYNDNGTLTLENVTVEGENITYALNLPGKSENAKVIITNSSLTGNIAINVWGTNTVITATDSDFTSVDNSAEEKYEAIKLNNDGTVSAEGSQITFTGGSITALDENGELSYAFGNYTATGTITASDTTTVKGKTYDAVAVIRYEGTDNFYSAMTLQNAFDKAKETSAEKVVLIKDIELTETVTVSDDIILDLNGKILSMTDSSSAAASLINNEGNLTITDSSDDETGKITFVSTTPSDDYSYSTSTIINKGELTVDNGTVENTTSGGASYAIDNAWYSQDVKLTVNGGTITATKIAVRQVLFTDNYTNTVEVNGGTLSGMYAGLQLHSYSGVSEGIIDINGGTFNGTYAFYTSYADATYAQNTTVDVSDGTFNGYVYIYNGKARSFEYPFESVAITGGTFNSAVYVYTKDAECNDVNVNAISGGTFADESAKDYLAEGYELTENTDGTYGVQEIELIEFSQINMKLGNDLSMFFYVLKNDITDDGSYAIITKEYADGRESVVKTVPYSEWETGTTEYRFAFDGIAAKEMVDNLNVVVYNSNDVAISKELNTSVKNYAELMFDAYAGYNTTTVNLIKTTLVDMLNYGAAAQNTLGYNVSNLANADLTDEQKGWATDSVSYKGTYVWGEHLKNLTLSLNSNIVLNFYFEGLTSDSTVGISYTDHYGKAVEYTLNASEIENSGSLWKVAVDTLVVADYQTDVTCTVYNADGSVYDSATCSMDTYCSLAQYEICGGIMKFASSAYAYLHK